MNSQDIMAREIVIKKVNSVNGSDCLTYSRTIENHVQYYMKDYFRLQDLLKSQTPANKKRIENDYIIGDLVIGTTN